MENRNVILALLFASSLVSGVRGQGILCIMTHCLPSVLHGGEPLFYSLRGVRGLSGGGQRGPAGDRLQPGGRRLVDGLRPVLWSDRQPRTVGGGLRLVPLQPCQVP